MKMILLLLALVCFSGDWLPAREGPELVIRLADAGIKGITEKVTIRLQDETTGTSLLLTYDPATLTARVNVDPTHRYTIAVDAPGFTPYRKYIDKISADKVVGIELSRVPPESMTEYTFLVVDKVQRSVVPDAEVRILSKGQVALDVNKLAGKFTALVPNEGEFVYEVTASEYQPLRTALVRGPARLIEVGLVRNPVTPPTQTVAFVAQDAFTKLPIAARFRLKGAGVRADVTATVTTAAHPEFGTELRLKQPYRLEVASEGYQNHAEQIQLDAHEPEPIVPRVVLLRPSSYEVAFSILDAGTLQKITPPLSFTIRKEGSVLPMHSAGELWKVRLAPDKTYEVKVEQSGYELFQRSLTFDQPTTTKDLLKSILLVPLKAKAPTAAVAAQRSDESKTDETVFENLKVGEAVRLDNVYFDQSSYILRVESYPQLDKLVKTLSVNPRLRIEIAGHTDNVGDARLNQFLSENRAKVISSYLVNKGIPESRLVWKGYGPTQPVAANDTEDNKALNRRVEFVVLEN